MSRYTEKIVLLLAGAFLAACASRPPQVQTIPSTAEASVEYESTEKMLNAAKDNSLDILAPKTFARAQESLDDARNAMVKGKSKEKVLENIANARGWLTEAEARGDVSRAAAKDLPDARQGAIAANAPTLFAKEFKKIEDRTRDLTEDAEKGEVADLSQQSERLAYSYRELEIQAVTKRYAGDAQMNFAAAKKADAAKHSPKTFAATEAKINALVNMIKANPRDTVAIARAGDEATAQSNFLMVVNNKTRAGNTEDLVLQTERQSEVISGLASDKSSVTSELRTTAAQLKQKEAALKTAEELRNELRPNEADVFVENNAVKVRLKGVQFGSSQANINDKSAALLEKVDKVLGVVGASSILVEGHTDSVGSPETNQAISERRAQAVQQYMINKGKISSSQIKAIGMGEEDPISDNTTSRGRAENRRIDLLIEPKVE